MTALTPSRNHKSSHIDLPETPPPSGLDEEGGYASPSVTNTTTTTTSSMKKKLVSPPVDDSNPRVKEEKDFFHAIDRNSGDLK